MSIETEELRAASTGTATCRAHGHRLGLLGREPVVGSDGPLYCRECAEFYYRRKLFSDLEGRVVDIACGPGDNFRYMSESADIVAVDISPDVLDWAQEEAAEQDMSVTFEQMDTQNLAFEDDSFDTVISTLSTCTFPDPVKALNEMGRVCHPDGEVRLLEHGKSTFTPYKKVQEWRRDSYVDTLGCRLLEDPAEIVEESDLAIEVEQKWWIGTLTGIIARPLED